MRVRSLALLLTLSAGLLSFILLSTLENAIQTALLARSRDLLGADLALSSRRWIQSAELDKVRTELQKAVLGPVRETETLELFTMAAHIPERGGASTPQLVELHVVEPKYPLLGVLEFEETTQCPTGPSKPACVHGDPALALRWNLQPGHSKIRVGEKTFIWAGSIARDTSRSLRGGAMAPRLILQRSELPATGLLRQGTTLTIRKLFALKDTPAAGKLEALAARLDQSVTDPGIQIKIPRDAAADEGRLLSQVGDFLGLTSLVGLILAFLGCYWLLRRLVQQNAQNWAILRVLAPGRYSPDLPFWKLAFTLALGATAASLAAAELIWISAAPHLSKFLFMEGRLSAGAGTILLSPTALQALTLALATLGFALYPSLGFLKRQSLMELLKNPAVLAQRPGLRRLDLALLVGVLWVFSRWVAHSWRVGGIFMAGLIASSAIAMAIGWLVLRVLEKSAPSVRVPAQKLALLALSRLKASSLLLWSTFTLGAMLISLIPLLQSSLSVQLADPRGAGPVPSLFLFDIQDEQLEPMKEWVHHQNSQLQFVTPMIRGRLLAVNGTPFEKLSTATKTREEEREARFRNRGFNLTYRSELTPSETLVEGQLFSELADRPPSSPEAVSIEKRFAQRLGIRLGDQLEFDIQGVPILAQVVAIRSVQWTSFQPNFFIVFEPRALRDAPKSFLASLPSMPLRERESFQRGIFEKFANVSTIDVTRLMQTLLEGFTQISQALAVMALFSALAGAIAVFGIATLRASERLPELQLIRLLGMSQRTLQTSLTSELTLLAASASVCGLALSTGLAGAMSRAMPA
ncbi:MAG: ABC transporter permease, partial [Oligoflexia bacterium]